MSHLLDKAANDGRVAPLQPFRHANESGGCKERPALLPKILFARQVIEMLR
jgi:hypothetical protein